MLGVSQGPDRRVTKFGEVRHRVSRCPIFADKNNISDHLIDLISEISPQLRLTDA